MSDVKVITNNVPRPIMDAYELTADERKEFDYLDWPAIDAGNDNTNFFRYKGELYDLGEFIAIDYPYFGRDLTDWRKDWHSIQTDSFFSATVVRYVEWSDSSADYNVNVVVGRVYS